MEILYKKQISFNPVAASDIFKFLFVIPSTKCAKCSSKEVFLLSLYQNQRNKRITVIELRHKNEQNVIMYISCEEISNNCNLLISHIILKGAL